MSWVKGVLSAEELHRMKRFEIVRAASGYFSRQGYHGTSLTEVAKELGLTKSALYYYFADKRTLLFECSREAHKGALQLVDGGDPSPLLRLRVLGAAYVEYVVDNELGFIMYADVGNLGDAERRAIIRMRDKFDARIRGLIEKAMQRGEIRTDNVKLAGFTILGALNWIPKWMSPKGSLTARDIADYIMLTVLRGLGASDANLGVPPAGGSAAGKSVRHFNRRS
jgi:TetR/AcrR family transcriptional regulator